LIKKFGRAGDGPREFRKWARLHFTEQYIIVQSADRLTYYSHKLDYVKERKVPRKVNRGLKILENGYLYSRNGPKKVGEKMGNDNARVDRILEFCDRDFKTIRELFRQEYYFKRTLDVNAIYLPEARRRIALRFFTYGNKIYVEGEDGETGNIYVLNFQGQKLFTLTHKYSKLKVKELHKKAVLEWHEFKRYRIYKGIVERKQAWFPEFFPSVHYFSIADGIIYTIPYRLEQGKSLLHIFKPDGTFLGKYPVSLVKNKMFSFSPFTIKRNKIYQLVENDDGNWEMRQFDINTMIKTMDCR